MAEQRDVHDPRQILKLANIVQTREKLRALYLSTIADIRSVSPEAWTSWKGGLIEALYRNTMEWLEVGEDQAAEHFLQRAPGVGHLHTHHVPRQHQPGRRVTDEGVALNVALSPTASAASPPTGSGNHLGLHQRQTDRLERRAQRAEGRRGAPH